MNRQFCQVPSNHAPHPQVNSIFRVDEKMGPTQRRFLLDSGAAVSVARLDVLDEKWHSQITAAGLKTTVGADGLPLEVVGQVTVPVSLGDFQTSQEFTVVKSLTADCILGADFLVKHSAIVLFVIARGMQHPRSDVIIAGWSYIRSTFFQSNVRFAIDLRTPITRCMPA